MAGVNYDEAIHKVYSRKKAAIAGTLSAAGFFFFEGILLAGCLEVKHMCASAAGDSL